MLPGRGSPQRTHKPPLPPPDYERRVEQGLRDRAQLRDSAARRDGDLLRPLPARRRRRATVPILLAWGPYGKHALTNRVFWPRSGVDPDWLSPLTAVRRAGSGVVGPAGLCRGGGRSARRMAFGGRFSPQRHPGSAKTAPTRSNGSARRHWSNGRVGMTGVSYLAGIQYLVAPLKPGPLAALNPWEGFSDWYREFAYHGGILETDFLPRASDNIRYSLGRTEDTWANVQAHPLIDDFWRSKELDLEAISPAGLCRRQLVRPGPAPARHARSLAAHCAATQKWLEVHGQKKWAHYYRPESRDAAAGLFRPFPARPANRRRRLADGAHRGARARTALPRNAPSRNGRWRAPTIAALSRRPRQVAVAKLPAECGGRALRCATRAGPSSTYRFDEDTEITGHASLRLWVEADGSDDMDLFVALQKLDAAGRACRLHLLRLLRERPGRAGLAAGQPPRARSRSARRPNSRCISTPRKSACAAANACRWRSRSGPFQRTLQAGESLRLVVAGADIYRQGGRRHAALPAARTDAQCRHAYHSYRRRP